MQKLILQYTHLKNGSWVYLLTSLVLPIWLLAKVTFCIYAGWHILSFTVLLIPFERITSLQVPQGINDSTCWALTTFWIKQARENNPFTKEWYDSNEESSEGQLSSRSIEFYQFECSWKLGTSSATKWQQLQKCRNNVQNQHCNVPTGILTIISLRSTILKAKWALQVILYLI